MAELGVGYISILPEVSKISPGVSRALNGLDPVADKSGKSMGSKISSGMGTALKASVAGVGLAAGGVLAGAVTKGMGRLTGIENAQASLKGLGHDAKSVDTIMDSALTSVRGTSFGLETAAGVAASAVAAGIKPGAELERTLKMTGDAATIAGVEMGEMGSIVNKVATSDMMQMDVANQMMDAGIPILQMVADEMGVTAEEARKMASDGKVSFETFQTALEKGVGGAALEAGNTFQGAFANMGAALGRLGATGLTPFFDLAKDGFGVATDAIDNFEGVVAPMAKNVSTWLQDTAVPAVKDFATAFQALGQNRDVQGALEGTRDAFDSIVGAGKALAPVVVNVSSAFAEAGAALGVTAWTTFVGTLEVAGSALELVAGPLETVTGFLKDHPGLVATGIAAWTGFKTIPGMVDRLGSTVTKVTGALSPAVTNTRLFSSTLGEAYGYARKANPEMGRLGAAFTTVAGEGGVASAAMGGVKGAASGLMGLFGGPWGVALMAAGTALGAVTQANQKVETAQNNMAEAARDSASAQAELRAAVAGTAGALNENALAAAANIAKGELAELVEMGEAYSGWLYSVDTDTNVWERMFNIGDQWEQDKAAARDIKAAFEELETAAESVGIPMNELNNVVAQGGPQFNELVSRLRESGDAGNAAADQLENTRNEIQQITDDARLMDPAMAAAAAAIDVLADSSSTADDKLGALQSMLQALGLAPKDAEQAMWDASEAVDELVESMEKVERPAKHMGDSLFDASGALDRNNEGSRELRDELLSLGDELQNVGANGGNVHEAFAEMQPGIESLAESFGISTDKVLELGRELGLVPDEIAIAMNLEGLDETSQGIADVWAGLQTVSQGQVVRVEALTEDAEIALSRAGITVESIPGSKDVHVSADTEAAQETLNGVFSQLGVMDGVSVSPTVLLNSEPLRASAEHADYILAALDIQTPTPQAQIIIDQLTNGVNISQGQLDFLASQTPTPAADLNRQLLESGVGVSHEMLTALNARNPKPVLDANGQPLYAAVDSANSKMGELRDKTVTITTVHQRIDYWTQQGHSPAQAARIQGPVPLAQHGMRIPALADGGRNPGYRLPATGPGTSVVDGFLGLDDYGMPTARVNASEWVINRDSSDRYHNELAAINAGVFPKLEGYVDGGKVGATTGDLLAFARGSSVRGQRAGRSLEGAPYVWGGVNWGDCSGAMAALARFAVGLDAFAGRFATGNQRSALRGLGFRDGLGGPGDFNLGWFNGGPYGGHTSGSIGGTNVEMGGGRGNGQIGGRAAPASHSQYTDHAHLPLGVPMRSETTQVYTAASQLNNNEPRAEWSDSGVGASVDEPSAIRGAAGGGVSTNKAPTSWSQVAGIAGSAFASGMVSDALGLFNIPDSPPAMQAYAQWQDDAAEDENTRSPQDVMNVLGGAMRAVVGDRPWPSVIPRAVTDLMRKINIPGFRDGGLVAGPGGPRDDSILARLSDQEFVVNADSTRRNRALLEHVNAGGEVSAGTREAAHYHFHGPDAGDLLRQLEARELANSMQFLGG